MTMTDNYLTDPSKECAEAKFSFDIWIGCMYVCTLSMALGVQCRNNML